MTWDQFSKMFRARYVPLVERERLDQEYLDLRETTKSMTEITKMFIERDLFSHEFADSE